MSKHTCTTCGTPLICPRCSGSAGGRKGGLASGPRKARTPEQARAAINARWERYYQSHPEKRQSRSK